MCRSRSQRKAILVAVQRTIEALWIALLVLLALVLAFLTFTIVWSIAVANGDAAGYVTASALTVAPSAVVITALVRAHRRRDLRRTLPLVAGVASLALVFVLPVAAVALAM